VNECRVDLDQSTDVSTASSNLTQHVQRYVDDGSLLRTQGQELIFTLPLASADKFASNFQLSNNKFILPLKSDRSTTGFVSLISG